MRRIEDCFEAVDRAFKSEAARIAALFRLELKTSLELPLSAPESPQAGRWSERRLLSQRRLLPERRLRPESPTTQADM
jgi:hypothetical protein